MLARLNLVDRARCKLPYLPPPPEWMTGKEALVHICEADKCSIDSAIDQIKRAVIDYVIAVRFSGKELPRLRRDHCLYLPPGHFPFGLDNYKRYLFEVAQICKDATIKFGPEEDWQPFEIRREDVFRTWPTVQYHKQAPIREGISEAKEALWPNGIPKGLKAKERDNRVGQWLETKGYSVPSGNGLSRAVQRVIKRNAKI